VRFAYSFGVLGIENTLNFLQDDEDEEREKNWDGNNEMGFGIIKFNDRGVASSPGQKGRRDTPGIFGIFPRIVTSVFALRFC
jgi:hypothetical protein